MKYGYQVWYSADTKRFSLRGLRGQYVLVDPDLKLVLVQTALSSSEPEFSELFALWTALRAQVQSVTERAESFCDYGRPPESGLAAGIKFLQIKCA